jgi:hypothetical protein
VQTQGPKLQDNHDNYFPILVVNTDSLEIWNAVRVVSLDEFDVRHRWRKAEGGMNFLAGGGSLQHKVS